VLLDPALATLKPLKPRAERTLEAEAAVVEVLVVVIKEDTL
jgi:hypothetical protein